MCSDTLEDEGGLLADDGVEDRFVLRLTQMRERARRVSLTFRKVPSTLNPGLGFSLNPDHKP